MLKHLKITVSHNMLGINRNGEQIIYFEMSTKYTIITNSNMILGYHASGMGHTMLLSSARKSSLFTKKKLLYIESLKRYPFLI